MDTHWLLGRDSRVPLSKVSSKSFNWTPPMSSADAEKAAALTKQMSIASLSEGGAGIVKGTSKLYFYK
jgi:hypothetical protein